MVFPPAIRIPLPIASNRMQSHGGVYASVELPPPPRLRGRGHVGASPAGVLRQL